MATQDGAVPRPAARPSRDEPCGRKDAAGPRGCKDAAGPHVASCVAAVAHSNDTAYSFITVSVWITRHGSRHCESNHNHGRLGRHTTVRHCSNLASTAAIVISTSAVLPPCMNVPALNTLSRLLISMYAHRRPVWRPALHTLSHLLA